MTYPGVKNGSGIYQAIINQLAPHRVYIEPFVGHGTVPQHKQPAIAPIAPQPLCVSMTSTGVQR